MEGILASVALGAMSYYADKIARGEKEEADNQGYDVWADEILVRNFPFLGAMGQGLRVGKSIPAVKPYLQFSDAGAERRYSDDFLSALLRPGMTTGKRANKFINEFDDPTLSTVNTFKQLTPYNNVVYLRWLFNQVAENSGSRSDVANEDHIPPRPNRLEAYPNLRHVRLLSMFALSISCTMRSTSAKATRSLRKRTSFALRTGFCCFAYRLKT